MLLYQCNYFCSPFFCHLLYCKLATDLLWLHEKIRKIFVDSLHHPNHSNALLTSQLYFRGKLELISSILMQPLGSWTVIITIINISSISVCVCCFHLASFSQCKIFQHSPSLVPDQIFSFPLPSMLIFQHMTQTRLWEVRVNNGSGCEIWRGH